MCSPTCIIFGVTNLPKEQVQGKRIIEVGSYDVNGSLRPIVESWNPSEYVGVDIEKGPGVDIICRAEDIVETFGKESFDIVVSTELLEHVEDWKKVISNVKNICKPGGTILITTRSYGYAYHGYPYDFWRFDLSDMRYMFSDCIIEKLERDRLAPGVFIKAEKPKDFVEQNLSDYELYSIIINRRVKEIDEEQVKEFQKKYRRRQLFRRVEKRIKRSVSKIRKFLLLDV